MTKFVTWRKRLLAGACAGVLGMALCVPAVALADDTPGYPGVTDGTVAEGNTATTTVGLKADESKISFSAPTVINFAMTADGTFVAPTANAAKIKNNSIFDIKVSKYEVTSDTAAKGVKEADFSTASDDNAYAISVTTDNSGATADDFAVSNTAPSTTNWTVAKKTGTDPTALGMSFTGHMKNVTSIWGSGHNLQSVAWTVAVA